MVKIEMYLNDAVEVQLLAQFEHALGLKRAQDHKQELEAVGVVEPETPGGAGLGNTQATTQPEPTVVMNDAPSEPPTLAKTVDDVTMQRSISEYATKHGIDKARERLGAFGVTRVGQVPEDRREEFLKALV